MIEIGGKPILWHIMKMYSAHGVNDFVICCGYKGYVIKEYFANYFLHMSDVTFDMAQQQDGSASAERRAVAGDAGRYRRGHDDRRPPEAGRATTSRTKTLLLHLRRRRCRHRYRRRDRVPSRSTASWRPSPRCSRRAATARCTSTATAVPGFIEKPRGDGGLINGGFFVLSPSCLDLIEGDETVGRRSR